MQQLINSDFYILNRSAETVPDLQVSADLIYVDPPFNLNKRFDIEGNLGFDDYWSTEDSYLTWYAKLITDCFNNLKKNGTLYCHNNFINNGLVLAKVSPEIRKAFDTNISWKRSHPHNNIKNGWGNITDSILVFKKGRPYFQIEYADLNEEYKNNSFNNEDTNGCYSLSHITGEKSRVGHKFIFNGFDPKYGWRKPLAEIERLHKDNLIHYGKNKPYLKKYLNESKGVPVQNFWNDIHPITRSDKNKREYPTQKPVLLLERIIRASCPPEGVVFDPFCGSGTTMLATHNVGGNRKCITSDVNPDALELCNNAMVSNFIFADRDGTDIWSV